jgi:putative endonuclease
MFFVYVLRSRKDGALYIGLTSNLDRRIGEHNSGKERTTRHRRPFDLVHSEAFPTRPEARAREKFFKSGYGREQLKRL